MPMSAVSANVNAVQCVLCKSKFTSQQYLDVHVHWKHKESALVSKEAVNRLYMSSIHPVYLVGIEHNDTVDHQRDYKNGDFEPSQASQIQKPKGRKSYTLDFKWKNIKLLDQMTQKQVKNKWQKVANFMGIPNKRLVIKCNKQRFKIKNEMNINKLKKGEGNIVPKRQRGKITPDNIDQREKFPLAAKLVVSEYKRRRQHSIKVSKLWFCKK